MTTMNSDLPQKLAEACTSFLVPLRIDWEFKEAAYAVLCQVLRECTAAWKGQPTIPRLAVATLIEIEPSLLSLHEDCPNEVRKRVEVALGELSDLIEALASVN